MRRNHYFLLLCILFLLLFITLLLEGTAFSMEIIWSNTFGGSKDDSTNSVAKTKDGGYIIAGFTKSKGKGNSDGWIIKLDDKGTKKWEQTYGKDKNDEFNSIIQTKDGGYIVAGWTNSTEEGDFDAWIVKLKENGEEEWQKVFGRSGVDRTYSIIQIMDGSYIAVGYSYNPEEDVTNGLILKIDKWGNLVNYFINNFEGKSDHGFYSVYQDKKGDFIVAGRSGSLDNEKLDFFILKIDKEIKDVIWYSELGASNDDRARAVTQSSNNGYIIAGYTKSYGEGNADAWVVELDQDGNKKWDETFGGPNDDRFYSIIQNSKGNYVCSGYTKSYGEGNADAWVVELNVEKENYGSIYVISNYAGASIYLDGIYKGATPKTIEDISPGSHTIKITKFGYEDITKKVTVAAGKTTSISADLARIAILEVTSTPSGAKVYINDIHKGITPFKNHEILPATYRLKISKADYQTWYKSIEVKSNQSNKFHADLTSISGSLYISSFPSGSSIYLDSKEKGHTPNTINDIAPGSYTLKITRPGYEDWTKDVEVTAGKTTSESADLVAFPNEAAPTIPLLLALILPALAIIFYLFIFPIKRKKKKKRQEGEKETIEDLPLIKKEDIPEGITETPSEQDEPLPDDPITREYQQIQEKMEEQAYIRTSLSQTKEKIKKAIRQAEPKRDTARLASLQAISSDLDTLSEQFEYGKLSCDDTQKELSNIEERLKKIN